MHCVNVIVVINRSQNHCHYWLIASSELAVLKCFFFENSTLRVHTFNVH